MEEAKDFGQAFVRGFADDTSFGATNAAFGSYESKNGWNTGGYGAGTVTSMAASCFYGGAIFKGLGTGCRGIASGYRLGKGLITETKVAKSFVDSWKVSKSATTCQKSIATTSYVAEKTGIKPIQEIIIDLDKFSNAGKVYDRAGLTRAGRALEKHGNRQGSVFPKAYGTPVAKNTQGQYHLDDILTHPNKKIF